MNSQNDYLRKERGNCASDRMDIFDMHCFESQNLAFNHILRDGLIVNYAHLLAKRFILTMKKMMSQDKRYAQK
jgi:hypothetical protein